MGIQKRKSLAAATPLLCGLLALAQPGCGLLIGNVKPEDQKSETYGVLDLAKAKPDEWMKLDPAKVADNDPNDPAEGPSEVSDAIYQNKKTAATISLNSACRPHPVNSSASAADHGSDEPGDLRKVTNLLLLGLSGVTLRSEQTIQVQNRAALQTTVRGKLNHEDVMLRTVVLRKQVCTYDLIYLAPPDQFQADLADFSQFVTSLRIK